MTFNQQIKSAPENLSLFIPVRLGRKNDVAQTDAFKPSLQVSRGRRDLLELIKTSGVQAGWEQALLAALGLSSLAGIVLALWG